MRIAVAVISKLPARGRTKTRLARTLGQDAAFALHRAFLEDELDQLSSDLWSLFLVHDGIDTPEALAERDRLLGPRVRGLAPGGRGLSEELHRAFVRLFEDHDRVVIVSGDVPHLEPSTVELALAALDDADLVLGPGPDGGYYLVALKAPHDVFTPITMSTTSVVKATEALARRMGLEVAMVASLTDIDEAQDLLTLAQASNSVATRTKAVMASLDRREIAVQLPSELQIEVTSRCNLRCSACLRTHEDLAKDADLTVEDFREIVKDLPRLERVTFQLNGEPMLSDHLYPMVREAVGLGAWTIVNTNGTLLDERRIELLLESGLHELRVALDGATKPTVLKMAGADILDRVLDGVRAMAKARGRRERPRISLWSIATVETLPELPALVRLAAEVGADEVYVQRLVLTGRGVAQKDQSVFGKLDSRLVAVVAEAERVAGEVGVALRASGRRPIVESLTPVEASNPHLACYRPWRSAVVTASRWVLPCCISSFTARYDDLKLGDLSAESWGEVWNGERYQALRRGLLTGRPLACCAACGREWSL